MVTFVLFMFVPQTEWQIVPIANNPYDTMAECRAVGGALKRNKIFKWPGGVRATKYACQKLTIEKVGDGSSPSEN